MTTGNQERLSQEIAGLARFDRLELRQRWVEVYGTEVPGRMSRELLVQAVAYKLQQDTLGGLSRKNLRKLTEVGKNPDPRSVCIKRTFKPGTRFLRQWQGRSHEVIVTEDGKFDYAGRSYRSLSAIARQITGTRWSGPAFFGIKPAVNRGG